MANRNFASSRMFTGHVMPVLIDTTFTVAPANGLGVTSMVGPYVQNVFMHTSTTPAVGNSNPATPNVVITNSNPANGTIVIQLQDNYNKCYVVGHSIISANGTAVAITAASNNLTVGVAYTITVLGDATTANWRTVGVPVGITPAVGVSFIALATGAGAGTTARVAPTATTGSAVASIEVVGQPNLTMAPDPTTTQGYGASVILQCRDYAGALVAPATGSIISVSLLLSNSSVLIGGE